MEGLEEIFQAFTKGEKEMDGRTLQKLCKDSSLLDKTFTTTDIDLLFARMKPKGGRKIDFKGFQACLDAIAEKKKVSSADIVSQVMSCSGPVYAGTKALPVKFHDDKSLYTGVHARGGPSTVDTGRSGFGDLSEMTNREAANIRGVNLTVSEGSYAAPKRKSGPGA